jgi:adenylosuccinate synthase
MSMSKILAEGIDRLTKGVMTIAVSCQQYGDTGKGKIVDFFAYWAEMIIRRFGGGNAGHSVVTRILSELREFVLHLIPCGILYDKDGKVNIMDSGMVIDPAVLIGELSFLEQNGFSYDNLYLSHRANLTLPVQIALDLIGEIQKGGKGIGTTGRGIGPTYVDLYGRRRLVINDLLNRDVFVSKLRENLEYNLRILRSYDPEVIEKVMFADCLGKGAYYDPKNIFNVEAIVARYVDEYGRKLAPIVRDTDEMLRKNLGKKKILFEGAQGALLSILHGSYPFVTSSDCTLDGLLAGSGLGREDPSFLGLGIIKGFYMTRVGAGPFPTELGGQESDDWCNGRSSGKVTREREEQEYPDVTVNDDDEFRQGVAFRQVGHEYGATTKRPRRTGWLSLPDLRHALDWSTKDLVLTKVDVLNGVERVKVCDYYVYQGPTCCVANVTFKRGDRVHKTIPDAKFLQYCEPHYQSFPGWLCSLEGITEYRGLPEKLRNIVSYITEQTGGVARIISTAAERESTIIV